MNKPKLKTVLITSILLAFIAAVGWVGYKGKGQKPAVRPPISSQSASSIAVVVVGDKKVVSNKVENYEVSVPAEWALSPFSKSDDVEFLFNNEEHKPCQIGISKNDNPDNISLTKFLDNNQKQLSENETVISFHRSTVVVNKIVFYIETETTEENGKSMGVSFSYRNKFYTIGTALDPSNDPCEKEVEYIMRNIMLQ